MNIIYFKTLYFFDFFFGRDNNILAKKKLTQNRSGINEDSLNFKMQCPNDVIDGSLITKETRWELFGGVVSGGASSMKPENYQRQKIIEKTELPCPKTNMRINFRENRLEFVAQPNLYKNGFDFSENFDGCQKIHQVQVYINLKCIVGKGGSQTDRLKSVYRFVEGQLKCLKEGDNLYFANILDGDEASRNFDKFNFLLSKEGNESIRNHVYVGDLKGYFSWINQFNKE